MELGTQGSLLQGLDYAYTLQGWLKGVNSADGDPNIDMGQDGTVYFGGANTVVSQDAYAYSLGYYTGDYTPIGGTDYYPAFALTYSQTMGDITGQSLYNGNISNTTLAINAPSAPSLAANTVGYTYHYDQLNRLKKLRQYTGIAGTGTWDRTYITLNDQENITYDGNGNILTYGRNGGDTTAQTIDSLTYNYNYTGGKLLNNQLQYIHDAVTSSGYNLDLRNQTNTNNYQYDGIGNITKDIQSGITNIGWTVYNKPDTIYKAAGNISYNYNTANQRISKTYNGLTTWYVRDAQGNVMGIYDNADSSLNWREQHLYGSSRLGMWTPNIDITDSTGSQKWQMTGLRHFELDNHLGNVMTTINDVRNPYFEPSHIGPFPGPLQYFTANVLSSQDYYAFGMLMPDRQYTLNGDSSYRYGFNGKENDNEVKGLGNQQDYGMRIYDPRVGRFLSTDPVAKSYPMLTPYQFASNRPIDGIDIDGLEYGTIHVNIYPNGGGVNSATYAPYDAGQNNISGPRGDGVIYDITTHMSVHGVTKTYNDGPIFIARKALTDYGNYYGGTPIFKVLKSGIIDFGNNADPSYVAKPVDGADNFAMMHDKGYDALGAVGASSLFNDWGTTPVDIMALNGWSSMSDAIGNGNRVDPYNHQKVTRQEVGALHRGITLFALVISKKQAAIWKFVNDNNIPGADKRSNQKAIDKNYQLFLQLYLIRNDDGTYKRNESMWNRDKDGNYTPKPLSK